MEKLAGKASTISIGAGVKWASKVDKTKKKLPKEVSFANCPMRGNENLVLPLTNLDIMKIVKGESILPWFFPVNKFEIKYFRGVFMKNELPLKTKQVECGIINLQNSSEVR